MKIVLTSLIFLSFLFPSETGPVCPVGGTPADTTVFVIHEGKKIYFCCDGCIPDFLEDPNKYLETLETVETDTVNITNEIEMVFEVFGMDCPGCHGGLEKLIKRIDGVKSVEANYLKKEVKISIHKETKLDTKKLNEAVTSANFTLGKRLK